MLRLASRSASEAGVDISNAIAEGDEGGHVWGVGSGGIWMNNRNSADVTAMLASDAQCDCGTDGDEAYIATKQAASNRKASNLKGRSVKKGGGFQAMGLNATLLKAVARKGFSIPTPIQRKTIPLLLEGQDVVGMARTGSGKTAAFVVPMIEKLKAHSVQIGARALIMSPSRELALQTLKVVKELGRGTDLRCVLLVGGDSLEDQFALMAENPDIIIATPGRFLHLKIEMCLDLSPIRYVVFDEADRLFEMGFAAQVTEILHALPQPRQTLLFSATLPKSLVEFARAGLQEPTLVRLDGENKISPDLESAYFTIKPAEKEGALLHILNDVIKVPTGGPEDWLSAEGAMGQQSTKRKRRVGSLSCNDLFSAHSTIVFAATKHRVDYLATLLRISGFAVSHVYGSLDQTARKLQVNEFRSGKTNILVVTDVAARGIDIPILANVINYDFPSQPKIFVHRVGRTARAGKRGRSYSLLQASDAPYLLDLQLFLGKKLVVGQGLAENLKFPEDIIVGGLALSKLERHCELAGKLLDEDSDLAALHTVAEKGEKLYRRTRNPASSESAKRARGIVASPSWSVLNPLFGRDVTVPEKERGRMLATVSSFRPHETVFETGNRGSNTGGAGYIVKKQRRRINSRKKVEQVQHQDALTNAVPEPDYVVEHSHDDVDKEDHANNADASGSDDDMPTSGGESLGFSFKGLNSGGERLSEKLWVDPDLFMSYTPKTFDPAEDRAYGVHTGSYNQCSKDSNFVEAARGAIMDLKTDDGAKSFAEPSRARGMRWDKKHKKYLARANDEDGSRGAKMIKGESGQKIAASYRSGRFEAWRKAHRISRAPRTGEAEQVLKRSDTTPARMYKHKLEKAPKEADRYRDDYYSRKKRVADAKEKRMGKYKDGSGKSELRGLEGVRRQREVKNRRKAKNARPAKRNAY
ncbi:MAG: ATP-dependent RNA helicase dbp10 [Candelina mexicana]|nr:MAG: ATP-dependent RNA helicase dbp10 [Candelina mexicana]